MIRSLTLASLIALCVPGGAAAAQEGPVQAITGTRLDVVATGEVKRVPDIAHINAGVVTQARTATAAIAQNAQQMNRVIAALKRAGIAERDIQTSSINLNPEYRYAENQPPVLTGYRAGNEVTVRFRNIAETGAILDALVAEGANQINGPMLTIDKPEAALDQARQQALAIARARAEIYARAAGMRVARILSISETGAIRPYPMPMAQRAMAQDAAAESKIVPGEQTLAMTLSVSFELR
ncbi:MAG TPA: SIMPL domain-containing protein [Allosphingosinicella sp.]|nr:SIMPL domain-containing protein [Allosphingosinicella sp.]